jgi:hypothetical protein
MIECVLQIFGRVVGCVSYRSTWERACKQTGGEKAEIRELSVLENDWGKGRKRGVSEVEVEMYGNEVTNDRKKLNCKFTRIVVTWYIVDPTLICSLSKLKMSCCCLFHSYPVIIDAPPRSKLRQYPQSFSRVTGQVSVRFVWARPSAGETWTWMIRTADVEGQKNCQLLFKGVAGHSFSQVKDYSEC